jgi:hypothetical protein
MEIVYKLWEGSWENSAVLRDRRTYTASDTTAGISRSKGFTSANPRRSGHR